MSELKNLFENNKAWSEKKKKEDPDVFQRQAKKQTPKYLWIGCADSRVPETEILGLSPGEVFVHRNVGNLVPHSDFNCLSALQYGVEYLEVDHIIVCGHIGCGAVAAALQQNQFGLVDNWLRYIKDVYAKEKDRIEAFSDDDEKNKCLVELNVKYQVMNVCHTTIVQTAWSKKKKLSVHGLVYDISTGLLEDLKCSISSLEQVAEAYRTIKP